MDGRIAITWGLVASAMALVSGKRSFLLVRFLLGVAEAGLFPGMLLYLTYGFRPLTVPASTPRWCWRSRPPGRRRADRHQPVELNGLFGLAAWQWMFLLEGLPTVISAVSSSCVC